MKTPDGIVVGEHQGLMYYTLGQRQGLGIGGLKEASDEPWYVAGKDLASNALLVVQGDHPLLYSGSLEAAEPHWIGPVPELLAAGQVLDCAVKIRYRQDDQPCSVTAIGENRLDVTFATPQAAVTPGQFAVFYAADRCLGGAVIDLAGIAETAKDALRKTG